ncbi:Orosomucoid-like 1 [Hibiscus trionum]|uniref:Orosomucoid-like 1 n=1 Tax=Hibiscus trionum TaxID=183268 RepID=A0A9W7GWA3_HIBTR|nr:Orosomucoid-like 1 [Hibiscus trionum]
MACLYVKAQPPADMNRNTDWFMYPGVWTIYILILFFSWLLVLSIFGCSPGMAWTTIKLSHFVVRSLRSSFFRLLNAGSGFFFCVHSCNFCIHELTCHFFHWKKGTPFAEDQGMYNGLTWWEQIDNGNQLTPNRKFLTVVPVALYLIASHTTDYQHPILFFNTVAAIVLSSPSSPTCTRSGSSESIRNTKLASDLSTVAYPGYVKITF